MPAPEIIWLASWPRSGNTLLRIILWHCFGIRSGSLHKEGDSINAPAIRGQTGCTSRADEIESHGMVFGKTHLNDRDKLRAIYIVRDGREACVSSWHYIRKNRDYPGCSLEEAIRGYDPLFGSWSEHVDDWSPDTRAGTLLVRYEDMVEYPFGAVEQIAAFIGVKPFRHEPPPFSRFQKLDPKFFRSGKTDSWRDEMQGDDLALFWELHGETMVRFGYGTSQAEPDGSRRKICLGDDGLPVYPWETKTTSGWSTESFFPSLERNE